MKMPKTLLEICGQDITCWLSIQLGHELHDFMVNVPSVNEESITDYLLSPLILQCGLERGMACQFLSYNQSVKALIPRQKENTPWVKHYPFSKPRSTTLCRSNPVRNT